MIPVQDCCSTAVLIQVHLSAAQGGAAGGFVPPFLRRERLSPCLGNLQPAVTTGSLSTKEGKGEGGGWVGWAG